MRASRLRRVSAHKVLQFLSALRKLLKIKKKIETCVFARSSLHMRREEKTTRCHWMAYCTYNMLNMFRALLCPSSGARDYMCVITTCGVHCLGCWLSEVWSRTAGYEFGMRDVAWLVELHPSFRTHSLLLWTWPPATSNQGTTLHRR